MKGLVGRVFFVPALSVAVAVSLAGQTDEFEAVSLKPNPSSQRPLGPSPDPATGEYRLVHTSLRNLILRAYPLPMPPIEIVDLPGWANDPYDFVAKARPGATTEQQQQMFRAFLADRLKLRAHYESRDQHGYNLVFARTDHKLGPGLKASTLDCSQATGRPAPGTDIVAFAASHCGFSMTGLDGTMTAGGLTIASLVRTLADAVGGPVVDKTSLTGEYAVAFRFLRFPFPAGREPSPDDPPSVFTSVQEQLGLKLESATVAGQILVIDRIERPTEN